ncbi:hypothetical protein ACQW02_16275 [Humitalea sp. 24SJ18S-53]|uniref:bestrophin-like domain n=1 Tax=Humitalea sp. 24SJ18S-53 TaxID=3422307 RepID=UPI003D676EE5
MSPILIAGAICIVTFGAALMGLVLNARVPEDHLDPLSRDVIKGMMGLVATMTALLLGLLIHAAQVTNDGVRSQVDEASASLLELDRALGAYGPDAAPARALFRQVVRHEVGRFLLPDGVDLVRLADGYEPAERAAFAAEVDGLEPRTAAQRAILQRVSTLLNGVGHLRILLADRAHDRMPRPFLVVMVFWLTMLFLGFGLLAPRNRTVVGALLIGAVSVAAAMFLILALNRPFDGLLRVPVTSLRLLMEQLR